MTFRVIEDMNRMKRKFNFRVLAALAHKRFFVLLLGVHQRTVGYIYIRKLYRCKMTFHGVGKSLACSEDGWNSIMNNASRALRRSSAVLSFVFRNVLLQVL